MPDAGSAAQERLVADELLLRGPAGLRTSPRWQAAMARAAFTLQRARAPWSDLRLPIAAALLERYPALGDAELAELVEAMAAVETAELPPSVAGAER
jgi:hypothetical protein